MDKRKFIKSALIAGMTVPGIAASAAVATNVPARRDKIKLKHWVWVDPHAADTEEHLASTYASWYDAGIRGNGANIGCHHRGH